MSNYLTPGVYVEEVSFCAKSIEGVPQAPIPAQPPTLWTFGLLPFHIMDIFL
jgi:hypothetical protein